MINANNEKVITVEDVISVGKPAPDIKDGVYLAQVSPGSWDGKYPAYFTRQPQLFAHEHTVTKEELTTKAWAENPSNGPTYLSHGYPGVVWIPLERVVTLCHTHEKSYNVGASCPACGEEPKTKKPRSKKNSPPPSWRENISTLGAQEGEFRGKTADAAYSEAWTLQVGIRLKALEEDRRQKEAVPTQGDYLEDWEGVEVKE